MADIVLNTGDTAWVLASTALVLLMTPGLALFYGGMVRAKSVLNMMLMSMVTIGIVSVLWVIYGFKLAFGYEANSQWYGEISLSGLGSAVNELTNNGGVYPIPLLARHWRSRRRDVRSQIAAIALAGADACSLRAET